MQRNAAIFVASYIITRYHKPCHVPRQLLTNPNRLDVVLTYAASIAACKLAAAQNHHIFPPAQGEKQLAHPNDGDSKTVCAILNLHRILISSNILPLRNRSSAWSSDCETVSSGTGRHDLISCPLLSRHWMHLVWGEHPQLKVILQLTSPAPMKKQRNLFRFWIISTDFYPIYIAFSPFAAVSYTTITCSSIFGHKSSGNSGSGSVNPLHFCRVGICIRQLTRSLLPGAIPFHLKGLDNLIQLVDTCRML